MMDFEQEYKKLNQAQAAAVDAIDGPVMVVAGPGTGKTQLLSMRVANILRRTDALARNILCLTFTESAATAMRERLLSLIGSEAHKVAIHTFHSFGVEVINQYPEYFYNGARFTPSDEVLQIEVIESILRSLPHDSPLAATMNEKFVYLRSINMAIGHLKKAGLTPTDLRQILADNRQACDMAEPILQEAFALPRLSKSHLPRIREYYDQLPSGNVSDLPEPFRPLFEIMIHSLSEALAEAEELGKTTPITAWRLSWLEKNTAGDYVFRDRKRDQRLSALVEVYEGYNAELLVQERYDFSDMVLQVLRALEHEDGLRFSLQEQYQYLMVDEFQDTNDGQLRLLYLLADHPVHEGSPDVMVVGDDDQAVYKFQGAEVNNVLHFQRKYAGLQLVTLTENYRSHQAVLEAAREVITQGEVRLETELEMIDKSLRAVNRSVPIGEIKLSRLETAEHEYGFVASEIKRLIASGVPAGEIAVLGRQHRYLEELMAHLRAADIPVVYERRSDALREFHIEQLIDMATLVHLLSQGDQTAANEYLSRVLSYPFWELDPVVLWRLSRQAYEERRLWLDIMLEGGGRLERIARWLLEIAQAAQAEPVEYVLDRLIGVEAKKEFVSPYRSYYFSADRFEHARGEYLVFLSSLRLLRNRLREYRHGQTIYLSDFIDFIEVHRTNHMPIVDETPFVSTDDAVHVMTAHKSKGLEFHTVFIISAQESVWTSSGGRQEITFPVNLPITPPGDAFDDQLRLFFVAMTRAKSNLYITSYRHGSGGREVLPVPFLPPERFVDIDGIAAPESIEVLETAWQSYHPLPKSADAQAVLNPVLETYQLNVTHFTKFLDLINGGPHRFLLESLLQFPQAKSPVSAYGTAVHAALQEAYTELKQGNRLSVAEVISCFERQLLNQRLKEPDYLKYLDLGHRELGIYLEQRYELFASEHLVETSFAKQGVAVGAARLSGRLDKIILDKDNRRAEVYDFKTGKALQSWSRRSGSEGLKAWRYQKQLIFYKLLVEQSRTWGEYRVDLGYLEFIKPIEGKVILLEYSMEADEVERTTQLIQAVWGCIMALDFPDVTQYEKSLAGIRLFENDLLKRS
ncbi:MAG: ATP-dependent DNA helicase [Candidatus Saccharimonadales bacterium]